MNAYALNNLSHLCGRVNRIRADSCQAYLVALADVIAVIILVVLPCILIMQLQLPCEYLVIK